MGWSLIFIVARVLAVRKFPILLYKKKDKDISPFFKFQFSRKGPNTFGISSP